jgi:hypothetical protein
MYDTFNIANWYWIIGGDASNVWSSARAMLVPANDADYVAWGRTPTPIDTMASLYDVFAAQYPAGSLHTYNADARYRRASGGVTITTISAVPFQSDAQSRNTVNSAYDYSQAQGTNWTINWKMQDGSFVVLSKGSLATLMNNMAQFVQACFACEYSNQTAIDGGTITTLAQIDAAFAAVKNVFP